MIDKDFELFDNIRENYSMAEKIYKAYFEMRKSVNKTINMKYKKEDTAINTPEFKEGFIAGDKVMSSILLDF